MQSNRIVRTLVWFLIGVACALVGLYVFQVVMNHGTYAPTVAQIVVPGVISGLGGFFTFNEKQ